MKPAIRSVLFCLALWLTGGCEPAQPSAETVVRRCLDAAIAEGDVNEFVEVGVDTSLVTRYVIDSYEVKNAGKEVVSVVVNYRGTERPRDDWVTPPKRIEMPQTLRFQVRNGRIVHID
ncbi:MAG: hypothetical protein ABSG50_06020 [Opitutaceae bacterium]|jgi:hypothetical protein